MSNVWDPELQRNGNSNLEYIYTFVGNCDMSLSQYLSDLNTFSDALSFDVSLILSLLLGILFSYGYPTLLSTVVTFYGSTIVIEVLF